MKLRMQSSRVDIGVEALAREGPPTGLGSFTIHNYAEVVPGLVWTGSGDGIVARVERIGALRSREVKARLAGRVRDLLRLLGSEGHPGILRPLGCGVETAGDGSSSRFAWMVAEAPGEETRPWTASYRALDSLADVLRFLHDRRFEHGGVALENLSLREADGTTVLTPWSTMAREESPAAVSRILSQVFEGAADVEGFASLLPPDAIYEEIRRRCAARREMRPANGLALLYLLRETDPGRKHAACLGPDVRKEQLQRLAAEWLSSPPFLETLAWHELQRDLASRMSVELRGGWGCGKTRWLSEIAAREHARGAIIAGGRAVTRGGAILEALEDLVAQDRPVREELALARGALEIHELTDVLVRATKKLAPGGRLVWLFDNLDGAERRTGKAIEAFRHWAVHQGPEFGLSGRLLLVTAETREGEASVERSADPAFHRVVIERLPENGVKQLVSSLIGAYPEADAFAAAIAEETKGNVYHTIELLRVLVNEEAVVPLGMKCAIGWEKLHLQRPDEVRPRPRATAETFRMPTSVVDMFRRQFATLDPVATEVLRALAVDGHDVTFEALAGVLDEPLDDVADVAYELQAAGLVELQEGEPLKSSRARLRGAERRKYFLHGMSVDARRLLHARFLDGYERRWSPLVLPGPLERWPKEVPASDRRERESRVEILMDHARGAASVETIQVYAPLAAASCRRRSDFRGARALYEDAVKHLGSGTTAQLRCRIALSDVLRITGELDAAESSYPSLLEECNRLGDTWARVHALLGLAGVSFARGRFADMLRFASEAHELAKGMGEPGLLALCLDYLAEAENRRGEKVRAQQWAKMALESCREAGDAERAYRMQHLLGAILIDEGHYEEARAHFAWAQADMACSTDRRQLIRTQFAEAQIAFECGRYSETFASCERAVAEARAIGDDHLQCLARLGMALAAMSRNDDATASRQIAHARRLLPKAGTSNYLEAALAWHESWRHFLRSDILAAKRFALRALTLTDMSGDHLYRGFAAATLGCVASQRGEFLDAREHLDKAIDEARTLGNRFHVHLFATYRADCEIKAWHPKEASDLALAFRLLQEALSFSRRSGALEVRRSAVSAIHQLTGIAPESLAPPLANEISCLLASESFDLDAGNATVEA